MIYFVVMFYRKDWGSKCNIIVWKKMNYIYVYNYKKKILGILIIYYRNVNVEYFWGI